MRDLAFDKELVAFQNAPKLTETAKYLCERRLDVAMRLDASYALEDAIKELRKRKQFVATMESCTAGRLSGLLTENAGASKFFSHGWVTYSEQAKIDAGVSADLIADQGVYGFDVAEAMAAAARVRAKAAYGIGITGIGGPDDVGSLPAGTVWIGIASSKGRISHQYHFPTDRSQVIQWAALRAIVDFSKFLVDNHPRKSQSKKAKTAKGKVV